LVSSLPRNEFGQTTILTTKGRLLKAELKKQTEAKPSLTSKLDKFKSDNDQFLSSLTQAPVKDKKLKTAMVYSHFVESRAAPMKSQNQKQQVHIQQLEMARKPCSRHREIFERNGSERSPFVSCSVMHCTLNC
jgi:hypothetical protein